MRTFLYNVTSLDDDGNFVSNEVAEITEEEILEEYYYHWRKLMIEKYGEDHYMITPTNCVDDWVVVHWAWEKKDEESRVQENG